MTDATTSYKGEVVLAERVMVVEASEGEKVHPGLSAIQAVAIGNNESGGSAVAASFTQGGTTITINGYDGALLDQKVSLIIKGNL